MYDIKSLGDSRADEDVAEENQLMDLELPKKSQEIHLDDLTQDDE